MTDIKRYLLLLMCILITTESHAKSNNLPEEINTELFVEQSEALPASLEQFKLSLPFIEIGEGTFSVLFWDLYHSQLLTTSGDYPVLQENEALLFKINYFADISRDDLIERTVEQWQHIGIAELTYQQYLDDLNNIWPDIVKGDSLALVINNGHSHFYFNENYIGKITDDKFGQLFIDIWLSEKTSQPALRSALLGVSNNG